MGKSPPELSSYSIKSFLSLDTIISLSFLVVWPTCLQAQIREAVLSAAIFFFSTAPTVHEKKVTRCSVGDLPPDAREIRTRSLTCMYAYTKRQIRHLELQ